MLMLILKLALELAQSDMGHNTDADTNRTMHSNADNSNEADAGTDNDAD